jgi:hypothetical protein
MMNFSKNSIMELTMNERIDIEKIEELTDKLDFIETFLRNDIPKVEKLLEELKYSSLFEDNFEELKQNLMQSIQEIKELDKNLKDSIKPLKEYKESLKELAVNLNNLKIKINNNVKKDIEISLKTMLEDFNQKEKESLDNLLKEIKIIINENNNTVHKIKDFVNEINFVEKSKIIYFIIFIFGIIVGIVIYSLIKG